jgi:hypothetical protein
MLDWAGTHAVALLGLVPVIALLWWTLPDLVLDHVDLPVRSTFGPQGSTAERRDGGRGGAVVR